MSKRLQRALFLVRDALGELGMLDTSFSIVIKNRKDIDHLRELEGLAISYNYDTIKAVPLRFQIEGVEFYLKEPNHGKIT